jgi:hypothetical protein
MLVDIIHFIPIHTDQMSDNNNTCSICFDECKDKRILDPCNHEFCQECILKWSVKSLISQAHRDPVVDIPKVTCPNCRSPISSYILSTSPVLIEEPVDFSPFQRELARIADPELEQVVEISFDSFMQLLPSSITSAITSSVSNQLASMLIPESSLPEVRKELTLIMLKRFFDCVVLC